MTGSLSSFQLSALRPLGGFFVFLSLSDVMQYLIFFETSHLALN